jgi:hypothetical protein
MGILALTRIPPLLQVVILWQLSPGPPLGAVEPGEVPLVSLGYSQPPVPRAAGSHSSSFGKRGAAGPSGSMRATGSGLPPRTR